MLNQITFDLIEFNWKYKQTKTHYMQSEIFQAFICYNFDDYDFSQLKTFSQYSNFHKL